MKLVADTIAIRFGDRTLLQGIDIALGGGEMVGLIGPNGAGKTTLLRVLARLRKPDAGVITLDGRDISTIDVGALARSVAYLAQNGEVHWPMRVETLVGLGRLPHRRSTENDAAAIGRALIAADVETFRDRTMAHLSGGERMRVLLARALAVEAPLLLADEPVAAADPLHQLQVMTLLRDAASRGAGVMVVLHDLSLAARFCDRLILIAEGGIVAQGSSTDVLTPAHLKRAYGVDMVSGVADGLPFYLPR